MLYTVDSRSCTSRVTRLNDGVGGRTGGFQSWKLLTNRLFG